MPPYGTEGSPRRLRRGEVPTRPAAWGAYPHGESNPGCHLESPDTTPFAAPFIFTDPLI